MPGTHAFKHPHDTAVSATLRFGSELIAWIAGPWAVWRLSPWLAALALLILVGLPSVFSTTNDKRTIVVATPGPVRVLIEFLQYTVAVMAPWFVWPTPVAAFATAVVVASILLGVPRLIWLVKGAPT